MPSLEPTDETLDDVFGSLAEPESLPRESGRTPLEDVFPLNNAKPESHKGKPGAPKGSTNALRHGLTVQGMPHKLRELQRLIRRFRDNLEAAVRDSRGTEEIGLRDAALISAACEHHGAILKARRYYRKEDEAGTLDYTKRTYLDKVMQSAADKRTKYILALFPGGGKVDLTAGLYDDNEEEPADA